MEIKELEKIASQVRRDILRMVHGAQSGHPGGSLGCTDLLVALYFEQMHLKEIDQESDFSMNGEGEDLFFLSNGHISPVWYSVLARKGYFQLAELSTYRQIDSRVQGHPTTHEGLPGIRIASGSLGQGNSVAMGAALAKRLNKDDRFVYCLMGDGEQQEGQVWEAANFAPHHNIDHLISFIDLNGQQIDGPTIEVMNNRDLGEKYRAFGWEVMEIIEGNDMASVVKGLHEARSKAGHGKPVMVLLHTGMGFGVDFMEGSHKWHGVAPNDEQLEAALGQLEETLGDY